MEKREKKLKSLMAEGKVDAYNGTSENTWQIIDHSPETNDLQIIHSPVEHKNSIFFKLNVLSI